MRIVVDLDGTICPIRQEGEKYENLVPYPGAIEKLKSLHDSGIVIIIQTARNMETQKSNVGRVMKNIGKVTLDWLEKYGVPYDEIYFSKPNADLYIDDRAFRFSSWDAIDHNTILENAKKK